MACIDPNGDSIVLRGERRPLLGDPLSESLFEQLHMLKYDYRHTRAGYLQVGALCVSLFVLGWGDASFGPLLPRILQTYHVRVFSRSVVLRMALRAGD